MAVAAGLPRHVTSRGSPMLTETSFILPLILYENSRPQPHGLPVGRAAICAFLKSFQKQAGTSFIQGHVLKRLHIIDKSADAFTDLGSIYKSHRPLLKSSLLNRFAH